jgi:hypothetical protein
MYTSRGGGLESLIPTMRTLRLPALFALAAIACATRARAADESVGRARTLDREGVRAYKEERYNDAIRYFEEAFRLGGPPSELWNIARCRLKLDQPEDAAKALEEYLGQKGLSAGERREADEQLREIEHRHSTLTVASTPSGSTVYLDGRHWAGVTPASMDVAPGSHTVTIEHAGFEPTEKSVEAKYGRAIIVDVSLDKAYGGSPTPTTPPTGPGDKASPVAARRHHVVLEAAIGAMLPRYGAVGGSASVAGFLHAAYVVVDARAVVSLGARATLTGDSWSNTIGAPTNVAGCATLPNDMGATAISAFVDGELAWHATRRLRLGGDLGLGFATWSASQVGGDLFVPACSASPGVKPAVRIGLEGSYAFSSELRLVASPFMIEAQPAFDGTRASPKDAGGPWLRFGASLGLAFDLF